MYRSFFFTSLAALLTFAVPAADRHLFFDHPADFFEETFLIGNGTQGAVIYGNPQRERLSLNDITFWSGEPDSAVFSPGAAVFIPQIREALDHGDYDLAENLQLNVQGHYSANYQPVGNLFIDFGSSLSVSDYSRRLNLFDATATVSFSKGKNQISAEYLASAPDSVIALKITAQYPIDFSLSFESPIENCKVSASGSAILAQGYAAFSSLPSYVDAPMYEKIKYDEKRGTRMCVSINAIAPGAEIAPSSDGSLSVKGAKETVVIVAIATSFNGSNKNPATQGVDCKSVALRRAADASAKSFADIRARHVDDYSALFSRANIDLGESEPSLCALPTDVRLKNYTDNKACDPDLEELYFDFGRYLLISCSRTPQVPANLQGLWNESLLPPWSSNYTTNINVEENYWPAEVTNLGELHLPLLSFIRQLPITGSQTAREYYGIDRGWCLGHNSDIWAITNPVGLHSADPQWANWNMGGAWISSHIWQHFLFSRDMDFLKDYYPALKGAAEFCLAWLVKDDNSYFITSPSTSPENSFKTPQGKKASTSAGGFADIAMIRQCLEDTRAAAETLGIDRELVAEINEKLAHLQPYKIGARGQLQEWKYDFEEIDPQHRHQSHLYGLYPGDHLSLVRTPELARAVAKSLEIKGDNTTGWSTGWRVNLLARLADAENAYAMYRRLLKYVSPDKYKGPDKRKGGGTYPNLLDAHAPFQIDGNFGGTAGVAEMLLQSTPDTIILLPALPDAWSSGSFKGLRSRCGVEIDAQWSDGKVTSLTLRSVVPASPTILVNGKQLNIDLIPSIPRTLNL